MTNIVQKGQQRWMRNTFTKKRTAYTSYVSFPQRYNSPAAFCFAFAVAFRKSYRLFFVPSVLVVFLEASSLLCVCLFFFFYLCCHCHFDPFPSLDSGSLFIVSCPPRPPDVSLIGYSQLTADRGRTVWGWTPRTPRGWETLGCCCRPRTGLVFGALTGPCS